MKPKSGVSQVDIRGKGVPGCSRVNCALSKRRVQILTPGMYADDLPGNRFFGDVIKCEIR